MIQTGLMMVISTILIFFSLTGKARSADLGLIDAAVLNSDSSRWVVLDARPKAEWEAGHIPGSRSFSWENYTRTDEKGVEFRIFPPRELAAALADLGIDEKTPVVIYGDADKSWGGEGWNAWVLSWLGHKGPIRVLDGGIKAWSGRNLALTKPSENNIVKKTRYQVDLKPQLDISTEELDLKKGSLAVVDVRSTFERLKARIPGSVHIPWEKFYKGSNRHPISSAELRNLLADHDIDTSRPVVYYCLGGIRSSYAWLVHQLAGLPTAQNYEGGMAAWQKRPAR
jgi:thiosulfate/3-mercaptopyruvate sulfurtransferase